MLIAIPCTAAMATGMKTAHVEALRNLRASTSDMRRLEALDRSIVESERSPGRG